MAYTSKVVQFRDEEGDILIVERTNYGRFYIGAEVREEANSAGITAWDAKDVKAIAEALLDLIKETPEGPKFLLDNYQGTEDDE